MSHNASVFRGLVTTFGWRVGTCCNKSLTTLVTKQTQRLRSFHLHLHLHLSLNRGGRWDTTDDYTTSFFLFFSVFYCPLGLSELRVCPFPDIVFPPLFLSALSSSSLSLRLAGGFWADLMNGTCLYHFSLCLFTMVKRSLCDLIACWILAQTSWGHL